MSRSMSDLFNKAATSETTTLELRAAKVQQESDEAASKVSRTLDVLRHYNWLQIARRATNLLKARLTRSKRIHLAPVATVRIRSNERVELLAHLIIDHRANHSSHTQVDLGRGRFVLMNHAVDLYDNSVLQNQALNRQTHLWRFQFHYHEFLLPQIAAGQWVNTEIFLNKWLDDFAPEKDIAKADAWHPYCISRRVQVWIWLLLGSRETDRNHRFSPALFQRLKSSLVQQCEHLRENLELDLGGNHLLENVTALAIASSVIETDCSNRWEASAARILAKQLPLQILPHGEHFERTPVYHGHMLGNLLKIEVSADIKSELRTVVTSFIDPMLQHLGAIVHPDGEVPLFADSVFAEAPSTKELLAYAQLSGREVSNFYNPENVVREAQGQYRVLRNDDAFVICDFGPIAADNLPAHGHCDALNLEVSIANSRWIVDSGNFNYSDDSMRHYCRSSMAHNVVTVNHQNQASVWGKFRMGKRPNVGPIQQGEDDCWQWASASHDGYQQLGVGRLVRIVALSNNAVACFDHCSIEGRELSRNWIGYVHFHPEINLALDHSDPENRKFEFTASKAGTLKRLTVLANKATIEQGWYCTEFGKRLVSPVIRYNLTDTEEFLGWVLHEERISCEIVGSTCKLLTKIDGFESFRWC